jgi:hypothetical protein
MATTSRPVSSTGSAVKVEARTSTAAAGTRALCQRPRWWGGRLYPDGQGQLGRDQDQEGGLARAHQMAKNRLA